MADIPALPSLPPPPMRGQDTGKPFSDKFEVWLQAQHALPAQFTEWGRGLVESAAAAGYSSVSTTSLSISAAPKSLKIEPGKMFLPGEFVVIADVAAPTANRMYAEVLGYKFATGELDVDVLRAWGGGTRSAWFVGLSGPQGEGSDTLPSFSGNARRILALNGSATATEWVMPGWELIGTLNPSSVANATFTSIPTYWEDLLIALDLTISGGFLFASVSPDGVDFGNGSTTVSPSGANTYRGAVVLFGRKNDFGVMTAAAGGGTYSTGTGGGPSTNASVSWRAAGGVASVRLASGTGFTLSGNASLYGRR